MNQASTLLITDQALAIGLSGTAIAVGRHRARAGYTLLALAWLVSPLLVTFFGIVITGLLMQNVLSLAVASIFEIILIIGIFRAWRPPVIYVFLSLTAAVVAYISVWFLWNR